ncbi:mediator complex [Striga asiatica]|uniref:Mediator complex n=1 Tax=Striga asiatica TaxID=4170 RepID=A0A5A7NZF6_STRAF|nr:mediator complex [Striga asiatica]
MDSSQTAAGGEGNGTTTLQSTDQSPMDSSASSAAAAASPIDAPKQNLTQVTNSFYKTPGILHQLYLTVASQFPNASEKCSIQVPMENSYSHCLVSLPKHLLEELELMPDEVETYREIRAASTTVSCSYVLLSSFTRWIVLT